MNWLIEDEATWSPDYPEADLGGIVSGAELTAGDYLTDDDYRTIFLQTGLGKAAADELLRENTGAADRVRVFEQYQDDFFTPASYECRVSAFIVHGESMRDEDGMLRKGFEIPDVRNGDIFITKATHSLGWRHGHAAVVVDTARGKTLEAILLGTPSVLQNVDKWRTYPSFIHLRLKDKNADAAGIAEFAKEHMLGVPYGLLTGIPLKAPEDVGKTQCSHVVWYPYERFGYDLDSDGTWLVTPKDIANSDLLEIVQVYGVNPEEIWPGNWPF
ncbi:MAG TPA: hypothetical protein VN381_00090 [Anaerovoracaceae bacterium]|nr:hypothetical protein [Anaerovoracaceae bacterium]